MPTGRSSATENRARSDPFRCARSRTCSLTRVLYRAVRKHDDVPALLPRLAQIGTQFKFALVNAKAPEGSTQLAMAWGELEQAIEHLLSALDELKAYGALTVAGLVGALGVEIRRRQHPPSRSEIEEKRLARLKRG
jgi:hypothetical protein